MLPEHSESHYPKFQNWLVEVLIPFLIFFGCFLAIVGRFTVPGHNLSWPGTYEALVHIWIGVAIAGAVYDVGYRWPYLIAVLVATVFEVIMFMTRVK